MLYHLCEGTRAMRSTWDEGKWVDYKKGKFEHHTVGKEASWEVVQGGSEGLLCQDGDSEGPGTVAAVAHEGQEGHAVISKVPESQEGPGCC